jgi:hypothetical protein
MTSLENPRDPPINPDVALRELSISSGLAPDQIREKAIAALYRAWIGNDPVQNHIPYLKEFSDKDADVVLRQLDPTTFVQAESFRHKGILYPAGSLTDLASVPANLTWLVARYGRHTLPAIVHDRKIDDDTSPEVREVADTEFRDEMSSMMVPFMRRWFMWAAVTLGTMFKRSLIWKFLSVVWILGYILAAALVSGSVLSDLVSWSWHRTTLQNTALVFLSPPLLSLVWGKRYRFGLIAAYSVLVLTVPMLGVLLALSIYMLAELAAKPILRLIGQPAHPISLRNLS